MEPRIPHSGLYHLFFIAYRCKSSGSRTEAMCLGNIPSLCMQVININLVLLLHRHSGCYLYVANLFNNIFSMYPFDIGASPMLASFHRFLFKELFVDSTSEKLSQKGNNTVTEFRSPVIVYSDVAAFGDHLVLREYDFN
ncbi:hypothetical protein AVEN_16021-1 [Araneus ventricosus]|uniref:Uncharacterized protein n=1 Tax=Araneus ventricosus TaxID=182803 RepID=A0A4Y2K3W4_ARAVE|nr:hypothetical protein AVEN_16021-1 [Araneus ventricosus]